MPALFLSAVDRSRVQSSVTFAANFLVLVGLSRQDDQGRLDDAAAQTQDQVQGGFFLNVIVG